MPREKSVFRIVLEPLIVAVVLAFSVRAAIRIYSIPSRSMAPTLEVGDHILVTAYIWSAPEKGDVIVFRSPGGDVAVKRITAISATNSYFVMGDNRTDSFDSRHWGLVSRHRVLGRARVILWGGGGAAVSSPARAAEGGGGSRQVPQASGGRRIFKWVE